MNAVALGRRIRPSNKGLPVARAGLMLIGMAKRLAKLLLLLKPKRRWMQFSLGKLFLLVTVLCEGLGIRAVGKQSCVMHHPK